MLKFQDSVIVRAPYSPRYRAKTIAEEVPDLGQFQQGFLTLPDLTSDWATRGVIPSHPALNLNRSNLTPMRDPHE